MSSRSNHKKVLHSFLLIFSAFLTFLWPKTSFVNYDIEIGALLFLVLYFGKKIIPQKTNLLESIIFTLIVLIVINSTGGVNSPFFFLIYFILFSLSLLLEPTVSLTLSLSLIIFFLLFSPPTEDFKHLLPIFSLAFLTPFALYLGKEYLLVQKTKKKLIQNQEETFLFLSLIIKNHLKNIKNAIENFAGDHQLEKIKKHTLQMEKLIEKFEKTQ